MLRLGAIALTLLAACRDERCARAPEAYQRLRRVNRGEQVDTLRTYPPELQVEMYFLEQRCGRPAHGGLFEALRERPEVIIPILERRLETATEEWERSEIVAMLRGLREWQQLRRGRDSGVSTGSSTGTPRREAAFWSAGRAYEVAMVVARPRDADVASSGRSAADSVLAVVIIDSLAGDKFFGRHEAADVVRAGLLLRQSSVPNQVAGRVRGDEFWFEFEPALSDGGVQFHGTVRGREGAGNWRTEAFVGRGTFTVRPRR